MMPEKVFSKLESTGELIVIRHGENGYHQTDKDWAQGMKRKYEVSDMSELADKLNHTLGITTEQRMAFEIGSMFGWHTEGAQL